MSVKATLVKREATPDHSFSVAKHDFPYFLKVWHHHEELELAYIIRSEGTRFVGDSIERFGEGELLLIGSHLPHMFQNDDCYFDSNSGLRAAACVTHFSPHFLKTELSAIPELHEISFLMERAMLGLKFSGAANQEIGELMLEMSTLVGLDKLLLFFKILGLLCKHPHAQSIASPGYINHFAEARDARLDKVYDYVMKNFQKEVAVEDLAALASMNKSSFCRYFKKTTQKTFTEFLNDVRIGFACKLLTEKDMNVLEVSYRCGYNNISHFNRQFKKKKGMSPLDYQKYKVLKTQNNL